MIDERVLGVAVVGCGSIGQTHCLAIEELDEWRVVALVDDIEAAARRQADRVEHATGRAPAVYTQLSRALEDPAVDVVVLGTPTGRHAEQAIAALQAGKHTIIEKPIATNLPDARRVVAAADEAAERGIVTSVISQHRFDPGSRIVADALKAGQFGIVTSAIASVSWWREQGYYDSAAWRGTWAMDGGGALTNQGVHTVDLLLAFLGNPIEIYGRTSLSAHNAVEIEDVAVATISFESGALAVLHASTAAYPGMTARIEIMGSKGSAVIDGDDDRLTYLHLAAGETSAADASSETNQAAEALRKAGATTRDTVVEHITDPGSHILQYNDILRAIRTGSRPGVTTTDGIRALAVIDAVYLSNRQRTAIDFEEVLHGKFDSDLAALQHRA